MPRSLGCYFIISLLCVACDSTSVAGSRVACASNPFGCPAGETCWAGRNIEKKLICVTAGAGARGEECKQVDTPTCGPGLMCAGAPLEPGPSHCWAYCDLHAPNGGCLDSEVCVATEVYGEKVYICWPLLQDGAR